MAEQPLKVGDKVRILEGVLAGHTGVIVSPSHEAPENWIAVQLTLFEKLTIIEMESEKVERA